MTKSIQYFQIRIFGKTFTNLAELFRDTSWSGGWGVGAGLDSLLYVTVSVEC